MREARALGLEVIDRCNLTVLLEPGQADLVDFLAAHQVSRATRRLLQAMRGQPTPDSDVLGSLSTVQSCTHSVTT